jgi:8-oxo-dGTP pyrophosphatase MutT (NUDIX family)
MNSSGNNLAELLESRLARELPGKKAQGRFAPELCYGRHHGPAAPDARAAAVLVLLYPHEGQWQLPLTLRPAHMIDHAGQICFPGGVTESGETPEHAALRELEEELGVPADGIRLAGRLSPIYVFASNFQVTPCVAVASHRPVFQPNTHEVADVIELPVSALLDEGNYGEHSIQRRGLSFRAPHIQHGSHIIWGATSMMLGELIAIFRERPSAQATKCKAP